MTQKPIIAYRTIIDKTNILRHKYSWKLWFYDALLYSLCAVVVGHINPRLPARLTVQIGAAYFIGIQILITLVRTVFRVYRQVWRYAGPREYISLILADTLAGMLFLFTRVFFETYVRAAEALELFASDLLLCLITRLMYKCIYELRSSSSKWEKAALLMLKITTGVTFQDETLPDNRIRVAIIGAGSIGCMLADELRQNPHARYEPVCFVETDVAKVGREIIGIPVIQEGNEEAEFQKLGVQEIVFALPNTDLETRRNLYERYKNTGCRIRSYDYPMLSVGGEGRRQLHDFAIEDLLFRSSDFRADEDVAAWYRGKRVLITGGGGSIGSELVRQIARCSPEKIVILDIYENGAYDIQQEIAAQHGGDLDICVEIASVTDADKLDRIFAIHRPNVVFHAAAHKHVPLMERNVHEAVVNNVFGTRNVISACEKNGVERCIMISTDKAVNPTNVMGATKRMCEMMVLSRSGPTAFSAVRFGNVLGSNGSVIPLFRRQIAAGGPITLTDKRIIRYFMTIPEACSLVMTSGAMARSGDLYVLDMGKPVRILDLAENMIKLSGLEPYRDIDIVEVGLRPGEKLYEELLIQSEELGRTANERIFTERDVPLAESEIRSRLQDLAAALETGDDEKVRCALKRAVPTFHEPEEINRLAEKVQEMRTTEIT